MSNISDRGCTPANEDCAQIGHPPDFERLNRLEVATHRAAVIARCGPPPDGCALISITNRHDFGIYRTLGLRIDAGAFRRDPSVAAYAEAVQDGLGSWVEAGFAPPVRYDDGRAPAVDRDRIDDIVRSEEHTSELQSLMRISYAVFCLKKKKKNKIPKESNDTNRS